MERFTVVENSNKKYMVLDNQEGSFVRFGYNNPPLYGEQEWNNYYSARGFAQKLHAKNSADGKCFY